MFPSSVVLRTVAACRWMLYRQPPMATAEPVQRGRLRSHDCNKPERMERTTRRHSKSLRTKTGSWWWQREKVQTEGEWPWMDTMATWITHFFFSFPARGSGWLRATRRLMEVVDKKRELDRKRSFASKSRGIYVCEKVRSLPDYEEITMI